MDYTWNSTANHEYDISGATLADVVAAIEGMDEAESDALLSELFDHVERPEFVYTHKWRVGDLLMWDNRCTMHRVRAFDETKVRDMRRTTVAGSEMTAEQAA